MPDHRADERASAAAMKTDALRSTVLKQLHNDLQRCLEQVPAAVRQQHCEKGERLKFDLVCILNASVAIALLRNECPFGATRSEVWR